VRKLYTFGVAVCLFLGSLSGFSQGKGYSFDKKQKKNYAAYPSPYDFRQGGWLFDAGMTGTFGVYPSPISTTDTVISLPSQLRPGISLEVGRYFNFKGKKPIIRFVDYSAGYKLLWNAEKEVREFNGSRISETFRNNLAHYVHANVNITNIWDINNYLFLQNTIGINVDYRFLENESSDISTSSPPNFVAQAHYRLGFGIMIDTDIALIPYVEVPLYNLAPDQKHFAQLDYFQQSFQTVIVGARLMLFRFGQKDCPKAINHDGYDRNGY
jgi:hypothetical protein